MPTFGFQLCRSLSKDIVVALSVSRMEEREDDFRVALRQAHKQLHELHSERRAVAIFEEEKNG
jgi:hypothetical protein